MVSSKFARKSPLVSAVLASVFLAGVCRTADAQQQVNIGTPYQTMNDSFYEYIGTSWGFQQNGSNGGFFFSNGLGFGPPPPFGGYDGSGSMFGFGGKRFRFNMIMAQGSSRSYTAASPSVTMIPGTYGSVQQMGFRPFVTGIIPIVGGYHNRRPMVIRPSWDEGKVRDYVTRRREQKAVELREEEKQAIKGPPLTRQTDDAPLFLKGQ
jgi:hypothetical protein